MRTGSIIAALLGNFASAQEPPELVHWQSVVAVEVPERCRAVGDSGALRIDCGGAALLLEQATGEDPRKIALQKQLEPFAAAGIPISPPVAVDCALNGAPEECLTVTISMPGAEMVLRSGSTGDWVGTCLARSTASDAVCRSVFTD